MPFFRFHRPYFVFCPLLHTQRLWHYRDQFGAIAGCTGSEDSSYSATMEVMATFQRITTALKEKLDAQADATRNAMVAKQVDVLPEHDPVRCTWSKDRAGVERTMASPWLDGLTRTGPFPSAFAVVQGQRF